MIRLTAPLLGVVAPAFLADAGPSPCEMAPAKCQTGDSFGAGAGVLSEPQVLYLPGASRPSVGPSLLVLEQAPPPRFL